MLCNVTVERVLIQDSHTGSGHTLHSLHSENHKTYGISPVYEPYTNCHTTANHSTTQVATPTPIVERRQNPKMRRGISVRSELDAHFSKLVMSSFSWLEQSGIGLPWDMSSRFLRSHHTSPCATGYRFGNKQAKATMPTANHTNTASFIVKTVTGERERT